MKNFLQKSLNIGVSKNKPVSLIHFLTNQCNARCPHCFIDFDDETAQSDKLSLESINKMTKSMGPQLMNVNFTGGEPFLDTDIETICEYYLKNTSIDSMFFSTNGAMTSKIIKIANRLSKAYPKVIFTYSISIDHIGDKHSDYRRVKKLYEKAIDSYRKLIEIGKNVQANVTVTVCDFNVDDIEEIFNELYINEKVHSITANVVRNEGVYLINKDKASAINHAYKKLVDLILSNDLQYKNDNFLAKMMNEKEKVMYNYLLDNFLNPHYVLPCHAGAGLLGVIYPNGDVYPCEVLDKKMGNLNDFDFNILELWAKNQELRNWIKDTKCHCTYECAWSYNILSSPKHMGKLALKGIL